jgi:O-antigen/teichoic acid export membrane protein
VPLSVAVAVALYLAAPLFPIAFGRSFAGAVAALRWLCLIPLLRSLHYAWGTAITACASQWRRTAAQAGVAAFNLTLNLWLIPRWGWHGAALASLLSDGGLALACFLILRALGRSGNRPHRLDAAANSPTPLNAR